MGLVYMVILMVSVAFMAGAFVWLHERFVPLFQRSSQAVGALIALPMIGFLMVIMLPMPVVVAALMVLAIGWWDDTRGLMRDLGLAWLLLVVSVALMGVHWPPVAGLPVAVLVLVVWVGWWGILLGAGYLPSEATQLLPTVAFAAAPLIVAPLWSDAPASVAADSAIILSALLGPPILVRQMPRLALSLRLPLACCYGFCVIQVALHGGIIFAATSVVMAASTCWYHARKGAS